MKAFVMKAVDIDKKFKNDEEYFLYEERSELKHELINGNLYEMSGASIYHNKFERHLANLLKKLINQDEVEIATEGYKVRTPNDNFFYPDVVVFTKILNAILLLNQFLLSKYYLKQPAGLI